MRDGDYTWAHAANIWRAVCEKLDQRRATSEHGNRSEATPESADFARPTTAWTRSRVAESNFEVAELRQLEARARVEGKDTQSNNKAVDNRRWSRVVSFNESTFDTGSSNNGESSVDFSALPDQPDRLRGAISTLEAEEAVLAQEVRLLRQQVQHKTEYEWVV